MSRARQEYQEPKHKKHRMDAGWKNKRDAFEDALRKIAEERRGKIRMTKSETRIKDE